MGALPETMPAAVYRRPGEVVVEEKPVPAPGPGEVLVEVDHCGICGSDIHMLLEGWGDKPGLVAGHEFTGSIAALGEGVDRLGARRDRRRRHHPEMRTLSSLPRRQAVAVREPAGFDRRRPRRRLRPLRPGASGGPRSSSSGSDRARGRTRRAAGGRAPRDHPGGCRAGRQRHGHGRRADRGAVGRRAGGARDRTGHRRRAGGAAEGAGGEARSRPGARPGRARDVPTLGARADLGARGARRARVLGKEGRDGGGLPPTPARRDDGPRRSRNGRSEVRPQPVPPQRAPRRGIVRLRPRRFRPRTRAAGVRRVPDRSCSSRPKTSRSIGSPTRSVGLAEGRFAGKVMVVPGCRRVRRRVAAATGDA